MRAGWRDARDPMLVLIDRQDKTCLGCEQLVTSRWSGTRKYVCSIGMQKASTDWNDMPRCKKYSDGENMNEMTLDQSQQVEELLLNWYRWQIAQSDADMMALWYKPTDRTCREAEITSDPDELRDESYQWVDDQLAAHMDTVMDDLSNRGTLTGEMRAAISVSMRNKQNGHKVWSSARVLGQHHVYQTAKQAMLPMLLERHLVKNTELA